MLGVRTQGLCIACEGIDGSGKSTLMHRISEYLQREGHEVMVTREPGGTPMGHEIRQLIMTHRDLDPTAEFLLFAADRAQHYHRCIKPALDQGTIVCTDRFAGSSFAYLGYGNTVDIPFIDRVHEYILGSWKPDITFYCRVSPQTAATRRAQRSSANRFDEQSLEWFARVIEGFDAWAARDTSVVVLDGEADRDAVYEHACSLLGPLLTREA